jgi:hypothetical protein
VDRNEAWKAVTGYACKVAHLVETDNKYKEVDDPKKSEGDPFDDKDVEGHGSDHL